jgi:hypothetical protein
MSARPLQIKWRPSLRKKKRINRRSTNSFKLACQACGKEHLVMDGTWVSLASGDDVCHNEKCMKVMADWYKEKDDAKKVDQGSARSTEPQSDSVLGKGEG